MFSPQGGGEAGSLSSPEKFIQVFPALLLAPESSNEEVLPPPQSPCSPLAARMAPNRPHEPNAPKPESAF
jgi:hypothetical protein